MNSNVSFGSLVALIQSPRRELRNFLRRVWLFVVMVFSWGSWFWKARMNGYGYGYVNGNGGGRLGMSGIICIHLVM